MQTIFTIGYEGATLSDFIDTLLVVGVRRVVDVRELAQSRRPGFSKNVLRAALEERGLFYEHRKTLGDPKAGREAARAGRHDEFQQIFKAHMETSAARDELAALREVLEAESCVLLCYERDHRYCHRQLLCDELQRLGSFQVKHIGVQPTSGRRGACSGGTERRTGTC
ncbi:MAG: DUF488 family protein [Pseudomonadota bacterium]